MVRALFIGSCLSALLGGYLWHEFQQRQPMPDDSPIERSTSPSPSRNAIAYPVAPRPAPPVAKTAAAPRAPARATYRCEGASKVSYQDVPCGQGERAAVISSGTLSSVAPQAPVKRRVTQQPRRSPSVAVIAKAPPKPRRPSPQPDTERQCRDLKQELRAIEAQERAGGPAYTMDRLRARKRAAHDAMWRLKC